MIKEKLYNVIEMLQSTDKENHTVALCIIENNLNNDNDVELLLQFKHSNCSRDQWLKDAPKAFHKIQEIIGTYPSSMMNITYKTIHNHILNTNQKPKQVKLFMEDFTNNLTNQMNSFGYDFIKEIKITYQDE